jgi:tRNA pseudouridine55 synthase
VSASQRGRRRRRGRDVNGILLLDKPVGISSNQALQRAKRLFDASKAGHTGNLDVQASGLLPVCFGEATKVCQFLLDADKHYVSEFTFGRRTTTGDAEGETLQTHPIGALAADEVRAAMRAFAGEIEQIPPMHSAIKRGGTPLYKLAHRGIDVPRESRRVRIDAFELCSFEAPRAVVDIRCSKGTYVRTLAEDLGAALGCGAYVSALRREGAGPFLLDQALDLEALAARLEAGGVAALDELLLPSDSALGALARVELSADTAFYLERGQAVRVPGAPGSGMLRLYDADGRFLGVGEVCADGRVAPRRLFHVQAPESQENSLRRHA